MGAQHPSNNGNDRPAILKMESTEGSAMAGRQSLFLQ